jgi:thiamine biosynthesis lipoprotein
MWIEFALLALITALAPPHARAADALVRYEASHNAMGTVFTLAAYGRDSRYLAEVADEVFGEIDRLDAQMSNYKPESELSAINREAARHAVLVEPKLFNLIEMALRTSEETHGAFDPTVGPLMQHWGFFRGQGRLPTKEELARVVKGVGYQRLKLDAARRTIRFDGPGIELDLGGIAKGYAVDRAVAILRENGITAALVSSGTSSLYALGSPPEEGAWEVTVRDPFDAHEAADVFQLRNFSLSTSGSYEKFFKIGGKTYCHIMNPHTGWPVENMLSSVVLARTATETDMLSTSFFVLGPQGARKYLASQPNVLVVLYQPAGSGKNFKRVVLRSRKYSLPPGVEAEMTR